MRISPLPIKNVVIFGMAILAIVVIWTNVVSPLLKDSSSAVSSTEEVEFFDPDNFSENTTDEKSEMNINSSVDTQRLFWNTKPLRDPFSPLERIASSEHMEVEKIREETVKQEAVEKVEFKRPSPPEFSALVAGQYSFFAMNKGNIVLPGDWLGDYQITAIDQEGVKLRYQGDEKTFLVAVGLEP